MLSPSVRGLRNFRCEYLTDKAFRPVPATVEDCPLQRSPSSEEQGGGQDLRQVLIGLLAERGLGEWWRVAEAARLCVFILLSYPCSVCVRQNDHHAHAWKPRENRSGPDWSHSRLSVFCITLRGGVDMS